MPYSTPQNVRDALNATGAGPNNTLDPNTGAGDIVTGANLTDEKLEGQIAEADATINNYIGRFYTVPVDVSDPASAAVVMPLSRDIAAYLATLTYRMSKDFTERDPVELRYRHAMKQLERVAEGLITLPLPTPDDPTTSQNDVYVQNQYEGDMFVPGDFSIGAGPFYPGWNEGRWNPGGCY